MKLLLTVIVLIANFTILVALSNSEHGEPKHTRLTAWFITIILWVSWFITIIKL